VLSNSRSCNVKHALCHVRHYALQLAEAQRACTQAPEDERFALATEQFERLVDGTTVGFDFIATP